MEILMNLSREIYIVLDLEPEEEIQYDAELLEQELYLFFLDATQSPSAEILKSRCESLRNHFTLFILNFKQNCNLNSLDASTETLTMFCQQLLTFIENLAKNSKEENLLLDLSNILTSINEASPYNSMKNFTVGGILKEKNHLENILHDIQDLALPAACEGSKALLIKEIALWEKIARKVLEEEGKDLENLLKTCKSRCESFGYLVACV